MPFLLLYQRIPYTESFPALPIQKPGVDGYTISDMPNDAVLYPNATFTCRSLNRKLTINCCNKAAASQPIIFRQHE
jgi:hypothetical protein